MGDGDGVDPIKRGNLVRFPWSLFESAVLNAKLFIVFFGFKNGLMDDWHDGFEVGAGSDLWNDAAVSLEDVDLGDDDVGEETEGRFGGF